MSGEDYLLGKAEKDLRTYVLGIDPGVNTGVAIWNPEKNEFLEVTSLAFWEAIDYLSGLVASGLVGLAVVEDSRKAGLWRQRHTEGPAYMGKIGRNVGKVDRDCLLWIQYFHRHEVSVIAKSTKNKSKKIDQARFRRLTGWSRITNEHGRDAGMSVFGFNESHIRNANIDLSIEEA